MKKPAYLLLKVFFLSTVLFIVQCGESDQEDLPILNVADAESLEEGDEGTITFTFTVSLDKAGSGDISTEYRLQSSQALLNEDYIDNSGILNFTAGEKSMTIDVEAVSDTIREDNETLTLVLFNPVNASIGDGFGNATILNDDANILIPQGFTSPETYPGYTLVWSDEFNENLISAQNWNFEMGNGDDGWGNNELQFYTSREQNVYLSGGNLVIEARKESFNGFDYTSTRMTTQGKQEFQYGRIDLRAALPEGKGLWPALWMLGANFNTVGWAACGEIDIMELVGNEPNTVHGTLHWDPWPNNKQTGKGYSLTEGKFSDEFHVFTLLWEENKIEWLLDDVKYHEINTGGITPNPFNSPFFFIFNVAVGGSWPGSPDNTTVFPQRMIVDYVRVFQ
jgi:beta-glucanase (GH16 family)